MGDTVDLIYKLPPLVSAIVSVLSFGLAFWALIVKRKEIFRGSIYNRQIDELLSVRRRLHEVWRQVPQTYFWAQNIKSLDRTLEEFKISQPEDWSAYRKFQTDCEYLFYSFAHPKNGLLPSWYRPGPNNDLAETLRKIAPFTMSRLMNLSQDEIESFQNILLQKISLIDDALDRQS